MELENAGGWQRAPTWYEEWRYNLTTVLFAKAQETDHHTVRRHALGHIPVASDCTLLQAIRVSPQCTYPLRRLSTYQRMTLWLNSRCPPTSGAYLIFAAAELITLAMPSHQPREWHVQFGSPLLAIMCIARLTAVDALLLALLRCTRSRVPRTRDVAVRGTTATSRL